MNKTKIPPPTDEEILSYKRVPVVVAARYIGMPRPKLADKIEKGEMPFGTAAMGKTKWTYCIDPQKLHDYKHNIGTDAVILRLIEQQKQMLETLTEIVVNQIQQKGAPHENSNSRT